MGHFVNGGETWMSYSHGEANKQFLVQMYSGSPEHRKFKQTFRGGKLMATVWGQKSCFDFAILESRSNHHIGSVL